LFKGITYDISKFTNLNAKVVSRNYFNLNFNNVALMSKIDSKFTNRPMQPRTSQRTSVPVLEISGEVYRCMKNEATKKPKNGHGHNKMTGLLHL